MDASRAYSIASGWGSYIYTGDPGSCFYAFPFGDGRPRSEAHRARCLSYIDDELLPLIDRTAGDPGDRRELVELRAWFETAPLGKPH